MNKSEVTDLLSKAKAAREFYIQNPNDMVASATKCSAFDPEVNPLIKEEVHVREVTASDEAITRLAEISLEALEVIGFYAEEKNWDYEEGLITKKTVINEDFGGKRAREFLQKIGET